MKERYLKPNCPSMRECAIYDRVLRDRIFYEDFIEQFHTMTEEELQKFDVFYQYSHFRQVDSHIYSLLNLKKFWDAKKCSAIYGTIRLKSLSESKIIQTTEYVISTLTKSFIENHNAEMLYAPEWCKAINDARKNCIYQILRFFPLSPNQIGIESCPDYRVNKIWLAIPDIEDNIKFVEKAMSLWGYTMLKRDEDSFRSQKYDTKWVFLIFAPDEQIYVTEEIYKQSRIFYHISPSKYESRILKQGLSPRCDNRAYKYPDRIYLLMERMDYFGENRKITQRAILELAQKMTDARLLTKSKYYNDYEYTVYKIDSNKLNRETKFSYDMDYYPLGIFTVDNISPSALEVIGHFDVNEDVPDFEL